MKECPCLSSKAKKRKIEACRCTQCKPEELPRWMQHRRTDDVENTSLRSEPKESRDFCIAASALPGEIVQVLHPQPVNNFIKVKLTVAGQVGWLNNNYLNVCPEGTTQHGRTAAAGTIRRQKLARGSTRFNEIQQLIKSSWCIKDGCSRSCGKGGKPPPPSSDCLRAYKKHSAPGEIKEVTCLEGPFLGKTGMVTGDKEVLFHGCANSTIDLILKNGFDLSCCGIGAFGQGIYFSPQACKAYSYSYNKRTLENQVGISSSVKWPSEQRTIARS